MVFQKSEFNPNNTRFLSQWNVSLGFTRMGTTLARYRHGQGSPARGCRFLISARCFNAPRTHLKSRGFLGSCLTTRGTHFRLLGHHCWIRRVGLGEMEHALAIRRYLNGKRSDDPESPKRKFRQSPSDFAADRIR